MIKPVNGHILIEPIKHEGFIATQRDTYNEIGTVIALPFGMEVKNIVSAGGRGAEVVVGDKVYFDSWLAAKYPKEGGKDDEFYWLIKWEDVRAIDYATEEISK